MTKRTRLKITYAVMAFLGVVIFFSIFNNMENLAIVCVTAITGAGLGYVWAETKRKSD